MPFTVPSDMVITNEPGHIVDHEHISDTLAGLGAGFNVQNTAFSGGADPSGSGDSTSAFLAAISAMGSNPGYLYVPPGTYKISSTLTFSNPSQHFAGAGKNLTFLNYYGTGDCLRMSYSGTYSDTSTRHGGITGLTVDGTNSSGSVATGVHAGDIAEMYFDVFVRNFTGSNSVGVHFDNAVHWTERLVGKVSASNNTVGVMFDVSGAVTSTNSFARADLLLYITGDNPNYDGVVLNNGAVIYNGSRLGFFGNFSSSGSSITSPTFGGNPAALRLTGVVPAGHPNAGGASSITTTNLNIGVECPSNTNSPTTFIAGAGGNVINHCYGVMDFGSNFTQSNWNLGGGSFNGPIFGDTSLLALSRVGGPLKIDNGFSIGHFNTAPMSNGATITTAGVTQTLTTGVSTGVTGIIMQAGTIDGQIITVINQSGSGTITFAASSSNVADAASDIIPALSAGMYTWSTSTSLWYRMA